ncbi:MAG: SIS domain-containing protein [Armatimonadetes bacterium]|nr:SIS domain-containing protein [Armatimonadota bacterium]
MPTRHHTHQMLREIHEQPQAIRETLEKEGPRIAEVAALLRERQPQFVILAARGTSDNAGTYLRYIVGALNGMVVAPAAPSLLTVYGADMHIAGTVVIGISQSGKATDVIEVLERSRELGAMTVALTNTADSPIVQAAEHALLTHAHEEKAVAATKTYTTALAVLYQLSACWAENEELQEDIWQAPAAVEQVFADLEPWIAARAERYTFMDTCTVLARGVNYATAKEIGLKLQECCLINPEPWSAADYMHGPIAALQPGDPVILLAPQGPSLGSMLEVGQAVKERQGEMIVFSDDDDALSLAKVPMKLPPLGQSHWSPIVIAAAGQLFAYYLAVHKGLNPDRPRGLRKVTLTY